MATIVAAVASLMAITPAPLAHAAGDELIGAASAEHLWLVLEPRGKAVNFELVHHPREEAGWHFRTQHTMTQAPDAIAARGDSVWLIMPPRSIGGDWRREVFTAAVELNKATGLYYLTPAGRLDMAPPLPGLGRIAGVAATPDGLVALLIPSPSTAVPVSGSGDSNSQPALARPMLRRLQPSQADWSEIDLPAGFVGSRESRLIVAGRRIGLLEPIQENPGRCTLHHLHDDGHWTATSFALDIRTVQAIAQAAGQGVVVLEGRVADRIDLAYLRPAGPLPFASAAAPDGQSLVCELNSQLLLIERAPGDGAPVLNVRTVDLLTGAVHEPVALTRQPVTAGRMWQMTLALGLALSIALAVLLLASRRGEVAMVDRSHVLPLGRRLAAMLIDLAIGAVPTMLLLKCAPEDLLAPPVLTFDPSRCVPYLVMVCVATAIALPMELLTRSSIGKSLMGGRIASLDGARPSPWRVLIRGLFRMMVLAIPPLAVFALAHSHLQGLPDIAVQTLVLRRETPPSPDQPEA